MSTSGANALGAHAYARLRFDDVSERAVAHLASALQWHRGSAFEGQFLAQSEARAGAFGAGGEAKGVIERGIFVARDRRRARARGGSRRSRASNVD